MKIRWTFGAVIGPVVAPGEAPLPVVIPPVVVPAGPVAKVDVDVKIGAVDGWNLPISFDAYSLDTANHLVLIRAYLIPDGEVAPADAPTLVAGTNPYGELDVSGDTAAFTGVVVLPTVGPGSKHTGVTVLGFEDLS